MCVSWYDLGACCLIVRSLDWGKYLRGLPTLCLYHPGDYMVYMLGLRAYRIGFSLIIGIRLLCAYVGSRPLEWVYSEACRVKYDAYICIMLLLCWMSSRLRFLGDIAVLVIWWWWYTPLWEGHGWGFSVTVTSEVPRWHSWADVESGHGLEPLLVALIYLLHFTDYMMHAFT